MITVSNGQTLVASGSQSYSNIDVLAGGVVLAYSGGSVTNTTMGPYAYMVVDSGGAAYETVISGTVSEQVVATGGFASGVTIENGGQQIDAASATNITVFAGGEQAVNHGTATDTTIFAGGTQTVGNIAIADVIEGGNVVAFSGATVANAVIAGGTLEVSAGASLGSGVSFATISGHTGGWLVIDGGTMPTAVVSGFAFGDTIDLASMGFVSGGSVSLLPNNVLQIVTVGMYDSGTYDIQLNPAQSFAGAKFEQVWDGNTSVNFDGTQGGTAVIIAPCFHAGTRIRAERGEVAVEDLHVGERVALARGGWAAVRWLGHRALDCTRHPKPEDVWPVRVAAGAFGAGQPARDLYLSPDHAVFVDGGLIPVRYLLNGATIAQLPSARATYWHVELDSHDVLIAEGLACESYLDTGNRAAFANGGTCVQIHPDFALSVWERAACAPLVRDGAALRAARQGVLARAARLGHTATENPALSVQAGGSKLRARVEGQRWRVKLPPGTAEVRLASRVWTPAFMRAEEADTRMLGVAIARLWRDGQAVPLDSASLAAGWHAAEPDWRWTDGAGEIAFDVAMCGRYWRERRAARRA